MKNVDKIFSQEVNIIEKVRLTNHWNDTKPSIIGWQMLIFSLEKFTFAEVDKRYNVLFKGCNFTLNVYDDRGYSSRKEPRMQF